MKVAKKICPNCKKNISAGEIFFRSFSLNNWSLFGTHCPGCQIVLVNKLALLLSQGIGIGVIILLMAAMFKFFINHRGTLEIPIIYPISIGIISYLITTAIYSWFFQTIGKIELKK